jgi:hypothetical protein
LKTDRQLGISRNLLSIQADPKDQTLFAIDAKLRRTSVTSSRAALSGNQKGKCFYCCTSIQLTGQKLMRPDVDHFFPHVLKQHGFSAIVDGIWNLVLACKICNRGVGGKFFSVPTARLLERLHRRNEWLVTSHHPLRETLIQQTGRTEIKRRAFLREFYAQAQTTLIHTWEPSEETDICF